MNSENHPLLFSLFTTVGIRGYNLYPSMLINTLGVASAGELKTMTIIIDKYSAIQYNVVSKWSPSEQPLLHQQSAEAPPHSHLAASLI